MLMWLTIMFLKWWFRLLFWGLNPLQKKDASSRMFYYIRVAALRNLVDIPIHWINICFPNSLGISWNYHQKKEELILVKTPNLHWTTHKMITNRYQSIQVNNVNTLRNHFVYAPSQWETMLQCNIISRWRGTFTTWSLYSATWLTGSGYNKDCPIATQEDNINITNPWMSGPWFNIKMSSYQHRKSHCGDKTILRPSYLHNGISYTGKTASLYWIGALFPVLSSVHVSNKVTFTEL